MSLRITMRAINCYERSHRNCKYWIALLMVPGGRCTGPKNAASLLRSTLMRAGSIKTNPSSIKLSNKQSISSNSQFAICELRKFDLYLNMKEHKGMRPHDIVVLLKILSLGEG